MKIFILSPLGEKYFTKSQIDSIESVRGGVTFQKEVVPFNEVPGLYDKGEKVVAIDPDFCNWKIQNEFIAECPDLKAIILQTTSFSWVDIDFAKNKNVPVVNLRGFSTIAVAEWAIMMMINLARKVPLFIRNGWRQDYVKHQGIELQGKTAGIIGLGRIGTTIAEKCEGLGMKVVYWSKNSRNKKFEYMELEKLMKNADVVFPAVAQNNETMGLITDSMLKNMKKTTIFVSIVHTIYNHNLLVEMVESGNLYGYGFETELPEFEKYKGNIWAGPELAWCTDGSMKMNAQMWSEAIINTAKGKFPNRVN